MGEFDLIDQYFRRAAAERRNDGVALGIGDDCALLAPRAGMQLAISSDMLVEGRHFLSTVSPEALGHKALAVNLSDLAACGAKPVAFTLALALPRVDEGWLAGFSKGLFALADAHGCALMGGDTTAGPLTICITVFGEVPAGQALLRSGAREGDDIYVSHGERESVGDARLALESFRGMVSLNEALFARVRTRMERPQPRVALGLALRGVATSAMDVSDGLLGDLQHILKASGVGAEIAIDSIAGHAHSIWADSRFGLEFCRNMVWAGGDDYELVFTAPPHRRQAVQAAARTTGLQCSLIGRITAQTELVLRDAQGQVLPNDFSSFDHFKT
jgi:thiamine-monophosphate kinase